MTNNEPEFKKPVNLPVQLCFFYNFLTGKTSFSSLSLDSFFETTLNPRQDPPFLEAFEGTDADFLRAEWRSCLQLKENETKSFVIGTTNRKNPLDFFFTVTRPTASSVLTDSSLIISVTRTSTDSSFQQQKKTPSAFNKEYAEFIELASHDLDSPLRKLSMLIERITSKYENTADKDTEGYVLRARACLSDMRSLIENLSLLARLDSFSRTQVSCDLENIILTVLKDLERLPEEKNVKMAAGSLPIVEGDIIQYRQLFTSLLENAFKFKKKGTAAEVEIFSEVATDYEKRLHSLFRNQSYFKITILDKGIGFRQEDVEKIFRPFVRLNGKSEYPGSGIGLAICKKIVKNHCGVIYAESDENFGTRFILFLPLSPD